MTIEINKTSESIVAKMIKSGKSYTAIKGAMLALDMLPDADSVDAYLKSKGVELGGRRKSFTNDLHDFLAASPRTEAEMFEFIRQNGSDKAWKYRKLHNAVRELTVRLHVELSGAKFEEVRYTEEEASEAA